MKILDMQLLTANKRAVDYIREYDALVITPLKNFQINIIIENSVQGKQIKISFLEDCFYPALDAEEDIRQEVIRRKL